MPLRNYSATAKKASLASAATDTTTSLVVMEPLTGFPLPPFIGIVARDTSAEEVVLVTAVSGSTLTVVRGFDSTPATSHAAGTTFEHGVSAVDLREANLHTNATADVHGVAGGLPYAIDQAEVQAVAAAKAYTDGFRDTVIPWLDDLEARADTHDHTPGAGGNIPLSSVTGLPATVDSLAPKDSPTFTGSVTVPEGAAPGEAVNRAQLDLKAPVDSPTFTGTVSAPDAVFDGGVAATDATLSGRVTAAEATFTGSVTVPAGTSPGHAVNKAQLDAVDVLALPGVRHGEVVNPTNSLGALFLQFNPPLPSKPRVVLITYSGSSSDPKYAPYVYDGWNPAFPAPSGTGFWVFGLPVNSLVRIYYLAIL